MLFVSPPGFREALTETEAEIVRLVGLISVEWSTSVDCVRQTFETISSVDVTSEVILSSIRNDRTERKIVRSLVRQRYREGTRIYDTMLSSLRELDSCAEDRNVVVHVGFLVSLDTRPDEGITTGRPLIRRSCKQWDESHDSRERLLALSRKIAEATGNLMQARFWADQKIAREARVQAIAERRSHS